MASSSSSRGSSRIIDDARKFDIYQEIASILYLLDGPPNADNVNHLANLLFELELNGDMADVIASNWGKRQEMKATMNTNIDNWFDMHSGEDLRALDYARSGVDLGTLATVRSRLGTATALQRSRSGLGAQIHTELPPRLSSGLNWSQLYDEATNYGLVADPVAEMIHLARIVRTRQKLTLDDVIGFMTFLVDRKFTNIHDDQVESLMIFVGRAMADLNLSVSQFVELFQDLVKLDLVSGPVLRRAEVFIRNNFDQFNSRMIADLIGQFVALGIEDCDLISELVNRIKDVLDRLTPQNIVSLLGSIAALRCLNENLLLKIAQHVAKHPERYDAEQLSIMVHTMTLFRTEVHRDIFVEIRTHFYRAVLPRLMELSSNLTGRQISKILWGFIEVNYKDPDFYKRLSDRVWEVITRFTPRELAMSIDALSRAKIVDARLYNDAALRTITVIRDLSAKDLTLLLAAFIRVGYDSDSAVIDLIIGRLNTVEAIKELALIDLYRLVDSLTRISGNPTRLYSRLESRVNFLINRGTLDEVRASKFKELFIRLKEKSWTDNF